jgi:hypothetical protein
MHTVNMRWFRPGTMAAGVLISITSSAPAAINLELRPLNSVVMVGDTIDLGLYAVSDSALPQTSAAMEVILNWDLGFVQLLGADQTGAVPFFTSGFLPHTSDLNNSIGDGDAMWIGLGPFTGPIVATPAGTLLSTFSFLALAPTPATLVEIPNFDGTPLSPTIVYDGEVPALDVTGTLTGATITVVVPAPGALAALAIAVVWCGPARRRASSR